MTKRTPKPKGVPMPTPTEWFHCGWTTSGGKRIAFANLVQWQAQYVDVGNLANEHARVMAWLANPAAPKGVRR